MNLNNFLDPVTIYARCEAPLCVRCAHETNSNGRRIAMITMIIYGLQVAGNSLARFTVDLQPRKVTVK